MCMWLCIVFVGMHVSCTCMYVFVHVYILCAMFVTNTVMSFYVNVSGLPQE